MMNVLIVDDDRAIVDVMTTEIQWKDLGITCVYTAYNVNGAKNIMSQSSIDIIISDIEMPQKTGLDLLKWVREEGFECEFLFLTCHEDFSFAKIAINYGASAYLTKPFNMDTMVLNIQKIVMHLRQKRSMGKNHPFVRLDFWKALLEGNLLDSRRIEREIEARHMDIKKNHKYRLIYSKLNNTDADVEQYGKDVFEYILEGMQSEILSGKVVNETVIKCYTSDTLCFVAVCEEEDPHILGEKCEELRDNYRRYFQSTLTCCISNIYDIEQLAEARRSLKELFDSNISGYGTTFYEKDVEVTTLEDMQILDLNRLLEMAEKKELEQILRYLKGIFLELSEFKRLNVQSLYMIKQEITQVAYGDMMRKGIQATKLFYDDQAIKLAERSTDSAVDMIRWCKHLFTKTFEYEEEIEKSLSIIDRINEYVHTHYDQDISRNEIAEVFFLTPEYLAKLYKKKTGVSIKSYINTYKIHMAKEFLKTETLSISDIAKKVGFDNFSYFSTLFKKITGRTPKEFRNEQ